MRSWAILAVLAVLLACLGCGTPRKPNIYYLLRYPDGEAWVIEVHAGRMYRVPALDAAWRDKKPLPPPE